MQDRSGYAGAQAPDAKEMPPHKTNNNKRKRDSLDNDSAGSRAAPGDSSASSTFHRASPANNNSGSHSSGADMAEQAAAFLAAHNTSGTSDDDIHHSANSSLDFAAALSQHNASEQALHPNGGPHASSASDTAAAALSHYSMTVPQATELSFQTQSTSTDTDRPLGTSFAIAETGVPQPHGLPDYGLDTLKSGTQAATTSSSPPSSSHKPAVGTEAWHKLRRDNHKEGMASHRALF